MDSFHVNDVGPQASALGKQRPLWRYIGVFSVASFIIGSLCGYLFLKPAQPVIEEDDLSTELNLGIDTLLEWFPEKNAKLKGTKQEIVFHMMNFTDESDSAVSKLVIDTSEMDDANKAIVIDRRLQPADTSEMDNNKLVNDTSEMDNGRWQAADKCKEAVLDFLIACGGWLQSFVKFSVTSQNKLRKRITTWLEANIVGPTQFQKFKSNILDFANSTKPRAKLKALWAIIKDAWKRGGGWIKEVFPFVVHHVREGAWPTTKILVKLAALIVMWIHDGPTGFIARASLQYLEAQTMVKSAKKCETCRSMTVLKKHDEGHESAWNHQYHRLRAPHRQA